MSRRFSTLTFSLCASMTVHTLVLCAMAWWYMKHPPTLSLASMSVPKSLAPIIIRRPPAPPQPPPPPPPPRPKDFDQATQMPLRDDSGETTGRGTANRSTPGEKPMEARQGLEQANLARSNKPPEIASKLDDMTAQAQAPAAAASQTPTPPAAKAVERGAGPPVVAQPSPAPNQTTGASVEIKGHSSPTSDTDSFAMVAKSNNVHFHDGKMDARQGRKVNTTRPNYGLAAMTDAQSMVSITVVLGVTVDGTGNVTDVTILHSSGSENIDLPTKEAVYNWWFEPKKDKDGRGLPDLWVVRID